MSINYDQLVSKIINLLLVHKTSERRSSIIFDKTLCGYLQILETLLKVSPTSNYDTPQLLLYLFNILLFNTQPQLPEKLPQILYPDPLWNTKNQPQTGPAPLVLFEYMPDDYVKCKSFDSRKYVYRIMVQILKGRFVEYFPVIMRPLYEVLQKIPQVSIFNYKPTSEIKSYHGYVGI